MLRERLPTAVDIRQVQLPEATVQLKVTLLMLALAQINDIADRLGRSKGTGRWKIG